MRTRVGETSPDEVGETSPDEGLWEGRPAELDLAETLPPQLEDQDTRV